MKVPLVADRLTETESKDNAQNLYGYNSDSHANHHVEMTDEEIVNSVVTPLKLPWFVR